VNDSVNIASVRRRWKSSIDRGTTVLWVFEHTVGVSMVRIVVYRTTIVIVVAVVALVVLVVVVVYCF
jgi:hypothetical protein